MDKDSKKILYSFIPGILLLAAIWAVFLMERISGYSLSEYGVLPRTLTGLRGIIAAPFLHGDINHIASNSAPLLVLVTGLVYFYRQLAVKVFTGVWLMGGFWLWLGGREAYHIGASGIIYGLTAFLLFSGIFRKDTRLMALSLLVVFLYGGMVWGVFPLFYHVSWEAHLFGAIAGFFMAWLYRKEGPQRKIYEWELEPEEEDEADVDSVQTDRLQQGQGPNVHIHYIYRPADQPESTIENENKKPGDSNE